jgi:hypothetical protein
MTLLGVILCEESIARIPQAIENASLIQGNECFVLKRKSKNFGFPVSKSSSWG